MVIDSALTVVVLFCTYFLQGQADLFRNLVFRVPFKGLPDALANTANAEATAITSRCTSLIRPCYKSGSGENVKNRDLELNDMLWMIRKLGGCVVPADAPLPVTVDARNGHSREDACTRGSPSLRSSEMLSAKRNVQVQSNTQEVPDTSTEDENPRVLKRGVPLEWEDGHEMGSWHRSVRNLPSTLSSNTLSMVFTSVLNGKKAVVLEMTMVLGGGDGKQEDEDERGGKCVP